MRHIKYGAMVTRTDRTLLDTVGRRQTWRGSAPFRNSAVWLDEEGKEGKSGNRLGTHTRGWEILSSYVYYYLFFPRAILQEAEVWHLNSVRRACRWVGLETSSWRRPVACQGAAASTQGHVYSFASRKRVSWGNNFTSNNDLFGSSWVT